jgi:glutaredoxin-related protein
MATKTKTRTIEQIDSEIARLERELESVEGTETEVYTRIVGYHRAVENWNKGKKEEFQDRVTFKYSQKSIDNRLNKVKNMIDVDIRETEKQQGSVAGTGFASYKMFQSDFCRNCPPVKNHVANLDMEGETIDVSTDLGVNLAREYNVMSTPTVLFFNENNVVVGEAHTVSEVDKLMAPVPASQMVG